jgi:hypothetical protein
MKIIISIVMMFLVILLQSCSDEITSPIDDGNTIVAKIKVGFEEQPPRDIVKVDLKIIDTNTSSLKTIKTNNSDSGGIVIFNNLDKGEYYIVPQTNESIGEVIASVVNIDSIYSNDTVEIGIRYYWNFNEYSSVIEVDTTINFIGMQSLFHNNGIRDTLYCQFDESNIPNWMSFSYNTTTFPPNSNYSTDSYLIFGYNNDEIPIAQLPITVIIPIQHQYGTVDYKVIFKLKQ